MPSTERIFFLPTTFGSVLLPYGAGASMRAKRRGTSIAVATMIDPMMYAGHPIGKNACKADMQQHADADSTRVSATCWY